MLGASLANASGSKSVTLGHYQITVDFVKCVLRIPTVKEPQRRPPSTSTPCVGKGLAAMVRTVRPAGCARRAGEGEEYNLRLVDAGVPPKDGTLLEGVFPLFLRRYVFFFLGLYWLLHICGCSGSTATPEPFPAWPIPSDLQVTGFIDLSEVTVHSSLGGITPALKARPLASLIDHSGFRAIVEDDSKADVSVDAVGKFSFPTLAVRDQMVVRCSDLKHPGFVLEAMSIDPLGLRGTKNVRVSVLSSARSFVGRALRNGYGRRVDPEKLADVVVKPIAEAIYRILEQYPEKMSESRPLEQVAEVASAVASVAASLNAAGSGYFPREWLILVYQAGDNDLELSLKEDVAEMLAVSFSEKISLLVQTDSTEKGGRLFEIRNGKEIEIAGLGSVNSADPLTLTAFATWGMRNYPAKKVALIIASHGLGWRAAPDGRGVIQDDGSKLMMTLPALRSALTWATQPTGAVRRPFDLIGFDACLMGMLELAYQLRDVASYLVVSEANEPSSGWPYQEIFKTLSPSDSAEIVGKKMGQAYQTFYEKRLDSRLSGCLSLIDMKGLVAFSPIFFAWVDHVYENRARLIGVVAGLRDALWQTGQALEGAEKYRIQAFEFVDYRDVKDLVEALREAAPQTAILADQVLALFPKVVLQTVRFGDKYLRANGLSLSLPSPANYQDYAQPGTRRDYNALDFCQDSKWAKFLKELNSGVIAQKVDGRNLAIQVSWLGAGDCDLLLGEPDPSAASTSSNIVWYSPAQGRNTPNGQFTADSLSAKTQEEGWWANQSISAGTYWVYVRAIDAVTGSGGTSGIRVKVSGVGFEQIFEKNRLQTGEQFQAAIIQVSTDKIVVQPVPVPSLGVKRPEVSGKVGKTK